MSTEFGAIVSQLPRAVVVITVATSDDHRGMTAASFLPISWEAQLVLINVDNSARTLALLRAAGTFVINFLGAQQAAIANRFARRELTGAEQFKGIMYTDSGCGARVLMNARGALECDIRYCVPAADHTVIIAHALRVLSHWPGIAPLIACGSQYHTLGTTTGDLIVKSKGAAAR